MNKYFWIVALIVFVVTFFGSIAWLFQSINDRHLEEMEERKQRFYIEHIGYQVSKFDDGNVTCYTWHRSISCVNVD